MKRLIWSGDKFFFLKKKKKKKKREEKEETEKCYDVWRITKGHVQTLSTPHTLHQYKEEDKPKFNQHVRERTHERRQSRGYQEDRFTLQTHAYGLKDSLPLAPHSCCMQKTPPTLGPDQNPLLQAAKVALTRIKTSATYHILLIQLSYKLFLRKKKSLIK